MPKEETVELGWLFMVIRRRWWLIASLALLAGIIAFAVTSVKRPVYEANATLLVQSSLSTRTNEYNALVAGERLALTYGQMLKGRPILESVIAQLGLHESPGSLAQRISAEPIQNTQLIRLTATSSSPTEAALLANTVAEVFITQMQQLNEEQYADLMSSMQGQMDELTAGMADIQSRIDALTTSTIEKEAKLARFDTQLAEYRLDYEGLQTDHKEMLVATDRLTNTLSVIEPAYVPESPVGSPFTAVVTLQVDQALAGGGTDYNAVLANERLAGTYSQILARRSVLESAIGQLGLSETPDALAKRVTVEAVPETQLIRLSVQDANPSQAVLIANTLAEASIAQIQAQQAQRYADILAGLQGQVDELTALIDRTQADYDALKLSKTQDEAELARLQSLWTESRADYRTLQRDYNDLNLTAVPSSDMVTITARAQVPGSPVSRRMLYTLIAVMVGAVVGIALAFLLQHFDRRISTPDDVSETLGLDTLGAISQLARGEELVMATKPHSLVAEDFRLLATNIRLSNQDRALRTFLVTSPSALEGKSTVVANLAAAIAQNGLKVVVVDADLRRSTLHKFFRIPNREGLTTVLRQNEPALDGWLHETGIDNLRLLTSGPLPSNPTEALGSQNMRELLEALVDKTDVVLIDSAPVLPVADTMLLAPAVDAVLLVLRANQTRSQNARRATESLQRARANLIGVALNASTGRKVGYYKR
jgi:capsular exopolysaccharide synthesis family protein